MGGMLSGAQLATWRGCDSSTRASSIEWKGYTDPGLQFLVWGRSFVPKTESGYRFQGGAKAHEGLDDPREALD